MAEIAAVLASTHHPFSYRASTATGADRPPFADEWVATIERFRGTLTAAQLTLFIAMFDRDHGPLEYQQACGRAMEHLSLPDPDIAT